MDESSSSDKKTRVFIIVGVVMTLMVIALLLVLIVLKPKKTPTSTQINNSNAPSVTPVTSETQPAKMSPQSGAIMKVGNEYIYDTDLNYELTYYPANDPEAAREIIIDKMIEDSVILQGAAADKMITLDSTIFNSKNKDYAKRIERVDKLKDQIDGNATTLAGKVISIWFNNMGAGSLGYDAAKQLAFNEISRIQKDLKDKRVTMDQAGYQIKNNTSLAQVDTSYKANAIFDFMVSENQKITYNPDIDKQIYALNEGDVSNVLVGKDLDPKTNTQIDSVYFVAQISRRSRTTINSYDKWLEDKTKLYAVEKY
jgi:uncharacterized protein (UPF0212 family)